MLSSWGWQAFASPGILPDLYIQLTKLVNLHPHRSKEIVHLSGLHIEKQTGNRAPPFHELRKAKICLNQTQSPTDLRYREVTIWNYKLTS